MKKYKATLFLLIVIISCKSKVESIPDRYSKIAAITNKSELDHMATMLYRYSMISNRAEVFAISLAYLEKQSEELKSILSVGEKIPAQKQVNFFDSFEKSRGEMTEQDSAVLDKLKNTPIENKEDVDYLLLFMTRSYLKNLEIEDRFLFNNISSSASVNSYNLKNGDTFSANLDITASNTSKPAEYYILKPGKTELTQENVADTLHPDESGSAYYQTKDYKIGENRLVYSVKIPSIRGDVTITRVVVFNVH